MAHQPVEEQYREKMEAVAGAIDQLFNEGAKGRKRKTAFVILVFPFGDADGQRCNYISNGVDRKDIATLFREMASRFEGQSDEDVGHA